MNTKALVAVIAFVAAASATAQFKSGDVQVASSGLGGAGLSLSATTAPALAFEATGRTTAHRGDVREASSVQADSQMTIPSERLSFSEPGKLAMLLAGLGVIVFVAGRRQQS